MYLSLFFKSHKYRVSMRYQLNTDTVICKLASAGFVLQPVVYEVSSYYKNINVCQDR